jgi:cell wall-associated NlpC family hydrolase
MGNLGEKIELENALPGDIILFSGTDKNKSRIGHVGLVSKIENDELFFLHSSSSKKHYGVTETNFPQSGYPKRFIKIIRITK